MNDDSSIQNHSWLSLLQLARQGDTAAVLHFCQKAEPLITRLCSKHCFAALLGKDEARSIAALSMVEFLLHEPLRKEAPDIPRMLMQSMKCDLINQARKQKCRNRRERYPAAEEPEEAEDEEATETVTGLPADSSEEPESRLLLKERNRNVRNCLQYLGPREQDVIRGIFFRQLTVQEIAGEMHCSPNNVYAIKYYALQKLKKIFKEQQIV